MRSSAIWPKTRGGEPWYPADPQQRALANQWMDWASVEVGVPMSTLFWQLVRTPVEKRDPTAIATATARSSIKWSILDAALAGRAYLLGDALTMADIPAGCWVHRWFSLAVERPELPNLRAWYERLSARPAYRKTVMLPLT